MKADSFVGNLSNVPLDCLIIQLPYFSLYFSLLSVISLTVNQVEKLSESMLALQKAVEEQPEVQEVPEEQPDSEETAALLMAASARDGERQREPEARHDREAENNHQFHRQGRPGDGG